MDKFKVQDASDGTAVAFGPNDVSVEIALTHVNKQHGASLVLTDALASNREIDKTIDGLKEEFEKLRPAAKQRLKSSLEKKRSRSSAAATASRRP